jgi:hypothetical protein
MTPNVRKKKPMNTRAAVNIVFVADGTSWIKTALASSTKETAYISG